MLCQLVFEFRHHFESEKQQLQTTRSKLNWAVFSIFSSSTYTQVIFIKHLQHCLYYYSGNEQNYRPCHSVFLSSTGQSSPVFMLYASKVYLCTNELWSLNSHFLNLCLLRNSIISLIGNSKYIQVKSGVCLWLNRSGLINCSWK